MKRPRWISPEEAVKVVQSGQRVYLSSACAEPQTLVEALMADRERLEGVELVTQTLGSSQPYAQPGMERHFWLHTLMVAGLSQRALREGRCDYIPFSGDHGVTAKPLSLPFF